MTPNWMDRFWDAFPNLRCVLVLPARWIETNVMQVRKRKINNYLNARINELKELQDLYENQGGNAEVFTEQIKLLERTKRAIQKILWQ